MAPIHLGDEQRPGQRVEVADMLGHTDPRMLDRHYRHKVNPTVNGHATAMDALALGAG